MKHTFALLACLSVTGCATVISSPRQTLTFRSLPQSAEVTVNGVSYGRTPLTAEVPRAKNNAVVLRAPGYEDDRFTIATGWNPLMLGNIIFFPWTPFFSTTDRANGANIRYEENHFYSVLDPVGTEASMSRAEARRHRLTRFLAVNDANLSRDLASGQGEYLDAVWQITATPEKSRDDALKTLRELRRHHAAAPDFAEAAGKALVKD